MPSRLFSLPYQSDLCGSVPDKELLYLGDAIRDFNVHPKERVRVSFQVSDSIAILLQERDAGFLVSNGKCEFGLCARTARQCYDHISEPDIEVISTTAIEVSLLVPLGAGQRGSEF